MKFEYLQGQALIPVLKETYDSEGITHVNLREYELPAFTWGKDSEFIPLEDTRQWNIRLEDLSHKYITEAKKEKKSIVGITSRAVLGTGVAVYIPQLDVDEKFKRVGQFFEEMDELAYLFPDSQDVIVAETKKGYHLYGTKTMKLSAWKEFMEAQSSQESSVDKTFLREMSARGFTNLRLTTGRGKRTLPTLLGKISQ